MSRRKCGTTLQVRGEVDRHPAQRFKRLGFSGNGTTPTSPWLSPTRPHCEGVRKILLRGPSSRAKKPIYWCISCKTALAEAEVSTRLTPPLPSSSSPDGLGSRPDVPALKEERVRRDLDHQPWTIPANLAMHSIRISTTWPWTSAPTRSDPRRGLMASAWTLLEFATIGSSQNGPPSPGAPEGQHPLYERDSLIVLAPT